VPTTSISLVREHTEQIRPPRALWATFELGRPLGAPGEPDFQRDVLRSALALLERPAGPVLEDYPHDAPAVDVSPNGWACPVALPAPEPGETEAEQLSDQLRGELARLRPWFDEALKARGRTTVGLSGLDAGGMDRAADFVARFAAGDAPELPEGIAHEWPGAMRFVTDDLKAFYFEAATAQPGAAAPSAQELSRWLFMETTLGDVLFRLIDRLETSEELREQFMPFVIVPGAIRRLRQQA
jgi:hypothetical protein